MSSDGNARGLPLIYYRLIGLLPHNRASRDRNVKSAPVAFVPNEMRPSRVGLQIKLLTVLGAVSTKAMHGLSWLHRSLLEPERNNARSEVGKVVTSLLSFPVFQAHTFCFKLTYALNKRRMLLMGGHGLLLGIDDGILQFNSPHAKRLSIAQSNHRLYDIARRLERASKASNCSNINHPYLPLISEFGHQIQEPKIEKNKKGVS